MGRFLEQRYVIKCCVKLGKTGKEIHNMINKDYSDGTSVHDMDTSSVFERHKLFREGRGKVEDDDSSGRPSTTPTWLPPDFFSVLKNKIDAQEEVSVEVVQQAVTSESNSISVQEFLEAYENWKTRRQQCIDAEGCYFEKF
ncbi:hypothetical protein TNCV_1527991 [Trichonephila clavipes]|nr:hypothetical protein TNCV_1527991 [Trichonephila clavipes]